MYLAMYAHINAALVSSYKSVPDIIVSYSSLKAAFSAPSLSTSFRTIALKISPSLSLHVRAHPHIWSVLIEILLFRAATTVAIAIRISTSLSRAIRSTNTLYFSSNTLIMALWPNSPKPTSPYKACIFSLIAMDTSRAWKSADEPPSTSAWQMRYRCLIRTIC